MALVSRQITLTADDRSWLLESRELAALVVVKADGGKAAVTLDEVALNRRLEGIAVELRRSASDAKLQVAGSKVEIVPGADGRDLDVDSSRTMLLARLGESTTIPLVVKRVEALPSDKLVDKNPTHAILATAVQLKFEDKSFSLSPDELAKMLDFPDAAPGGQPQVKVNGEQFASFAKAIAKQVDREPEDARFKYEGGRAKVVADGHDGVTLESRRRRPRSKSTSRIRAGGGTACRVDTSRGHRVRGRPDRRARPDHGVDHADWWLDFCEVVRHGVGD